MLAKNIFTGFEIRKRKIGMLTGINTNQQNPTFKERQVVRRRSQQFMQKLKEKGISPSIASIAGLGSAGAITTSAIAAPEAANFTLIGTIMLILGAMFPMVIKKNKKSAQKEAQVESKNPPQNEPSLVRKKLQILNEKLKNISQKRKEKNDRIWVENTLNRLNVEYERDVDGLYIIKNSLIVIDEDRDINFDKLFQYVKGIEGSALLKCCKNLTSLGKVEFVKGYLQLKGTPINNLGELKVVNDYVVIEDTPLTIKDFANVQVRGDIWTRW